MHRKPEAFVGVADVEAQLLSLLENNGEVPSPHSVVALGKALRGSEGLLERMPKLAQWVESAEGFLSTVEK